ncbi:MAG: hypothetical protein Q4C55_05720 [Eubacterium sp.]|nr:hypothetical protein [Eubacterium sp.]
MVNPLDRFNVFKLQYKRIGEGARGYAPGPGAWGLKAWPLPGVVYNLHFIIKRDGVKFFLQKIRPGGCPEKIPGKILKKVKFFAVFIEKIEGL